MAGLFEPGRIGNVTIPNRIVMPSMTTRTADFDGHVTDATIAYFRARAEGGVGLVTIEMSSPEKVGRHRYYELGMYDDRFLPGLARLADAIHAAGAKASIQLGHGGGHTREAICGATPIAPSAVPHPVFEIEMETIVPEAMSQARIEQTTRAFVAAAARAKAAGIDCVEIHAAHGYLISQFLCPEENIRTDRYGGSLENRARFGLDILSRVKQEVGGIGVIFRLGVEDFFPNGLPFEDGLKVAEWAAERGADALHITAGHYRSRPSAQIMTPPMARPDATFLDFAHKVRSKVGVPVIAVGRLGDPKVAEAALAQGKADFIALGRTLLADPEWPRKVRDGRPIRRCLSCNTCINDMRGGKHITCLVNPRTGRETLFRDRRPPAGERIAVVGAGPAGLAYAGLVAPGNSVVVFDKAGAVGGAFRLAGLAPLFQEVEASETAFDNYLRDQEKACREAGVRFRLNVDARSLTDEIAGFDRVAIATGADYRYGLGAVLGPLLRSGAGRWPGVSWLMSKPAIRDWFYYRARRPSGEQWAKLLRVGQKLVVIGDAAMPGKSKAAIASAYAAALLGDPGVDLETMAIKPMNVQSQSTVTAEPAEVL
jgi:dimethylglycine catabolism A